MTPLNSIISFSAIALLAGCAVQQPSSVSIEHKGKTTIVHHRRRVGTGAVDHIEAISSTGAVTQAEIHVYDVGRLPDGSGGVIEAHREYRVVQDRHVNLNLPKRVSSGPRTVYTPPNYSPVPADQRISDAVAEARDAKKKLDDATNQVRERLSSDNALSGELQEAKNQNQILQDKLNASMSAGHKAPAPNDAQNAAQTSVSDLAKWGQSQGQQ